MVDVHDKPTRSRNMAAIKHTGTKPERHVRSYLHRGGFRFAPQRTARRLPGKPDVVLPRRSAVVFVHGCYWHRHTDCPKATVPKSNVKFWTDKLEKNRLRDIRNEERLRELGWRVFVIWECELEDDVALRSLTSSIRAAH